MIIDTHCHLDFEFEGKTTSDLIAEARDAGVSDLITIGTDVASLEKLEPLASHDHVYFAAGIHPHHANEWTDGVEARLRGLARHPRCVGLGEMGLDYFYENSPRDEQRSVLQRQLNLANELSLPIVVHARDAEDDLIEMLRVFARDAGSRVPGVIHCFSGSRHFAEAMLSAGFYLSISGIVTFKKAEGLREIVKGLPRDRLLVETDAPFLAPVPFRGKPCEPRMVVRTAEYLAGLFEMEFSRFQVLTRRSTQLVFPRLARDSH